VGFAPTGKRRLITAHTHCGHSSFQAAAGRNLSDIFTLAGDLAAPPLAGLDPNRPVALLHLAVGRTTITGDRVRSAPDLVTRSCWLGRGSLASSAHRGAGVWCAGDPGWPQYAGARHEREIFGHSTMRRGPHEGQMPRRLQENATSFSTAQPLQPRLRKPWARMLLAETHRTAARPAGGGRVVEMLSVVPERALEDLSGRP